MTPEEHVPTERRAKLRRAFQPEYVAALEAKLAARDERIEKLTEALREAYPWIAAWNRPEADGLLERIAEYVNV